MVVAKDFKADRRGNLGKHVVADLVGCDCTLLEEVSFLQREAASACAVAGATVLSVHGHKFEPQGATAMVLLAESHLSIHTWPEHRYAAVDVYTCGPSLRPEEAVRQLARHLGAEDFRMLVLNRGVFEKHPDGRVAFSKDLIECESVTSGNGGRPSRGGNGKVAPRGPACRPPQASAVETPHPAAGSRAR